jgi:hypothetical protein
VPKIAFRRKTFWRKGVFKKSKSDDQDKTELCAIELGIPTRKRHSIGRKGPV